MAKKQTLAKKLRNKIFGRTKKTQPKSATQKSNDDEQIITLEMNAALEAENEAPIDESDSLPETSIETSDLAPDYSTQELCVAERFLPAIRDEQPKSLHNEWENGMAEESTRKNCALVKSCYTPAELTLLLNSAQGATLARLYDAYHLVPYPYGGEHNNELQIRDFVEYEFKKREGATRLPLSPEMILEFFPNTHPSTIEIIALENLDEGINAEKQRVFDFVREINNAGTDFQRYFDVIGKFGGVRYRNKSRDGFIDSFQMIFQTQNDLSLAVNILDQLRNNPELRETARNKISFWKMQYERLNPVALAPRIRNSLTIARFDAWLDVIDRCDPLEPLSAQNEMNKEQDYIDAEFVDVADTQSQNEPDHQCKIGCALRRTRRTISADEWKHIEQEALNEERKLIDRFRQISSDMRSIRKRNINSRRRKSSTLPGQLTINFN